MIASQRIPTPGEIADAAAARGRASRMPWAWRNLVGLWLPMAGCQGGRLIDWSGFARSATPVNSPTWGLSPLGDVLTLAIASSQHVTVAPPPVTGTPLTMACVFACTNTAAWQDLMGLYNTGSGDHRISLSCQGGVGGDPLRIETDAGAKTGALTTSGYTSGRWHVGTGVSAAPNSRAVYIDGGSKGTDATSLTPSGINILDIGRQGDASPGGYFEGTIALAAIWACAHTDDQVARFARDPYGLITAARRVSTFFAPSGTTHALAGTIAAQSTASAALVARRGLAGSLAAAGGADGTLIATRGLAGSLAGQAGGAARLIARRGLAGTLAAQSSAAGTIGTGAAANAAAAFLQLQKHAAG